MLRGREIQDKLPRIRRVIMFEYRGMMIRFDEEFETDNGWCIGGQVDGEDFEWYAFSLSDDFDSIIIH
jgi:hypothetical protein